MTFLYDVWIKKPGRNWEGFLNVWASSAKKALAYGKDEWRSDDEYVPGARIQAILHPQGQDLQANLSSRGVKKNPAKAQKREKTRKASVQRRVAVALAKFLKQANPAMKTSGAQVQRLKGGVLKITPIKANASLSPNLRKAGARAVKAYEKAMLREARVMAEYGTSPSPQATRASKVSMKARARLRVLADKAEMALYPHDPHLRRR